MSLRERIRAIVRSGPALFSADAGSRAADEPTITVTVGNDTRSFTRGELFGEAGR